MADIQKLRSNEPLLRRTAEQEVQESQSVEANEAPPIKQLDGEVTRQEEIAFGGGMYFEVWVGRWEKGGGEEVGGKKVSLSLTTLILLMWLFAGGLESLEYNSNKLTRGAI
jgi:hypothetical protein